MKKTIEALKKYYPEAESAGQIIHKNFMMSEAFVPFVPILTSVNKTVLALSVLTDVEKMYREICEALGMIVTSEILKSAAKIIRDRVIYIIYSFSTLIIGNLIIGECTKRKIVFTSTYFSGLMFLRLILSVRQSGKDINTLSERDITGIVESEITYDNLRWRVAELFCQ